MLWTYFSLLRFVSWHRLYPSRRQLFTAIALWLVVIPPGPLTTKADAQSPPYTTVSGQVIDPNGIPYAFGTVTATFVTPGGGGTSPVITSTGQYFTNVNGASTLDGTGNFTLQLVDNTQITPAGTKWNFTVCENPGVQPPLGNGSVCFSTGPITISGSSQNITATLNASAKPLTEFLSSTNPAVSPNSFNGEVNLAALVSSGLYSDVCAAASAQASYAAMWLPPDSSGNGYTCAGTLSTPTSSRLRGSGGISGSMINCPANLTCLQTQGGELIDGISVNCSASSTIATDCVLLKGTQVKAVNGYITGGTNNTNLFHIGPVNGSVQSGTIFLENWHGAGTIKGNAIVVDHVNEFDPHNVFINGNATNPNNYCVIVDTGTSSVDFDNVSCTSFIKGGIVRCTTGCGFPGGSYNGFPDYLWFRRMVMDCSLDTCNSNDGWTMDSTLGTTPVYAKWENGWTAAYVHGFGLHGGQGTKILSTTIRSNQASGIVGDNANVASVEIADNFIDGNNTSNGLADANGINGIDIQAGISRITIANNDIGNHLDTTGHQQYGWRVALTNGGSVTADDFSSLGNKLKDNVLGSYYDNNAGAKEIAESSVSGGTSCVLNGSATSCQNYFSGDFHIHGSTFLDGNLFGQTLQGNNVIVTTAAPTVTSGQVGLGSGTGFGNGTAGTAVTTTLKNTGTGPATPQTVVNYLQINVAGTTFWIPLVQ